MPTVRRTLEIVAVTIAALLLIELYLDTPLYRLLQPAILSPGEGALVSLPLVVQWDGPPRLALSLHGDDGSPRDLGMQRSPFELTAADLPEPGIYRLKVRAPFFGALIQSERRFAVAAASPTPSPSPVAEPRLTKLNASLNALKAEHEQSEAENLALNEELAALRQENNVLMQELDRLGKESEEVASRAAAQRERQAQLAQENQTLNDQVNVLQYRLSAALTCTVWGYYSYPHPQTFPPTRRSVTVSDGQGTVFRTELGCESVRRTDPTVASRCFCLGTPLAMGN